MKCQILFSGKNKKNISKCRLLKFLPRVLRVNFVLMSCFRVIELGFQRTGSVLQNSAEKAYFLGNNLHRMSKAYVLGKVRKMSSAEIFAQRGCRLLKIFTQHAEP